MSREFVFESLDFIGLASNASSHVGNLIGSFAQELASKSDNIMNNIGKLVPNIAVTSNGANISQGIV